MAGRRDTVIRPIRVPSLCEVLSIAEEIAERRMDGHMTILRFTTGWKVILGTPELNREVVGGLQNHDNLSDALVAFIEDNDNVCKTTL